MNDRNKSKRNMSAGEVIEKATTYLPLCEFLRNFEIGREKKKYLMIVSIKKYEKINPLSYDIR